MQRSPSIHVLFIHFTSIFKENPYYINLLFTRIINSIKKRGFTSSIFLINDISSLEKYLEAFIISTTGKIVSRCAHFVISYNNFGFPVY